MQLRKVKPNELTAYEALYEISFPDNEKKPFSLIISKCQENKMDMLVLEDNQQMIGIMITILSNPILLDYFAIDPKFQNSGYGSQALALLKQYYQNDYFGEIEHTLINPSEQKSKRKAFYLRNGMIPMDFCITLYGVEMEVISSGVQITYEQYLEILSTFMSHEVKAHISLLETVDYH